MRGRAHRIRHQLQKDPVMGEQFRDAQRGMDSVPLVVIRKVDMVYTEPLVLGNLPQQPEGIEAIRIIDLTAQETAIHAGSLCHFVWQPAKGGAHIKSIDGMSVAADGGKTYRITFRLTFAAPAGGANG